MTTLIKKGVTVKTWSSWDAIVNNYQSFVEYGHSCEPMLEFSHQVATSRYASGLFPAMSHLTLLIGQVPDFEWMREVIHIEYRPISDRFRFDFWESPHVRPHWSRECEPAKAFEMFEHLLRAKNWFLEDGTGADTAAESI